MDAQERRVGVGDLRKEVEEFGTLVGNHGNAQDPGNSVCLLVCMFVCMFVSLFFIRMFFCWFGCLDFVLFVFRLFFVCFMFVFCLNRILLLFVF